MKESVDVTSHPKCSDIKVGDLVVIREPKQNKLSLKFNPLPYTVVARKGSRVTVHRDGHYVTSNISFLKKLSDKLKHGSYGEDDDKYDYGDDPQTAVCEPEPEQNGYAVRNRHNVQRYGQNIYDK
eukprot:gene21283-23355_t